MVENMSLEQKTTAAPLGILITTTIHCGLKFQSQHTVPYLALANLAEHEHDSFMNHVKYQQAAATFKKVWEHCNVNRPNT